MKKKKLNGVKADVNGSVLTDLDKQIEEIFNMTEAQIDEKLKQLGYKDPDAMAEEIMRKVRETLSGKTDR